MPIPTTPAPALVLPLADAVYDRLVRDIIEGTMPPGYRIDEERVARDLGVSRAPVREAIDRLARYRLVEVVPRRFTVVTAFEQRETCEVMGAVFSIARHAMRCAADALTSDDLARLRRYRDTVLSDRESAVEALRTSRQWTEYYGVFVERWGNREALRLIAWVGPYARRFCWAFADNVDIDAEIDVQREEIEAALRGDTAHLVETWEGHTLGVITTLTRNIATRRPDERPGAALLRDRVTDTLRDAIYDGTLLPGETLRESELMHWLGVSRTPVREALARLEDLGIVKQRRSRSAQVAAPTPEYARWTRDLLFVLLGLSAQIAIIEDPDRVAARMREALDRVPEHGDRADHLAAVVDVLRTLETGDPGGVLRELVSTIGNRLGWQERYCPVVDLDHRRERVSALLEAVVARDLPRIEDALALLLSVPLDRSPARPGPAVIAR